MYCNGSGISQNHTVQVATKVIFTTALNSKYLNCYCNVEGEKCCIY